MRARPKILCVGRLYCDVIFTGLERMPELGTEVYADGLGIHPGGGAPISAGHFCALGHETALAAMLPAPPLDGTVTGVLKKGGLDLSLCRNAPEGDAPQITVALVEESERAFITHRTGPAFPCFVASDLKALGVDHVHIGEAATLIECPDLVDIAKAAGASLSLDCSWDDKLDGKALASLLSKVDVFLPNEMELEFLTSKGLSAPFGTFTVVKQGGQGATAMSAEGTCHAPAQAVELVDTTGAGDAFNAGFLSAWLDSKPVQECLKAGHARGALAVGQTGGFPIL